MGFVLTLTLRAISLKLCPISLGTVWAHLYRLSPSVAYDKPVAIGKSEHSIARVHSIRLTTSVLNGAR
jgi:hypothetical protein